MTKLLPWGNFDLWQQLFPFGAELKPSIGETYPASVKTAASQLSSTNAHRFISKRRPHRLGANPQLEARSASPPLDMPQRAFMPNRLRFGAARRSERSEPRRTAGHLTSP